VELKFTMQGHRGSGMRSVNANVQNDENSYDGCARTTLEGGQKVLYVHVARVTFDHKLFDAGHTHSGHPLAMAAGLGTLKALQTENLFSKAYEIEGWLRKGLNELSNKHECIGNVRGIGAYFAIETVKDRTTKEPVVAWQAKDAKIAKDFHSDLLAEGLYVHGKYNLSVIAPPLIVTEQQVADGIAILDRALGKLEGKLGSFITPEPLRVAIN